MRNGKCPMCGSSEVYSNPDAELRAGADFLQLTDLKNRLWIDLTPYVCAKCGFVAAFATHLDDVRVVTVLDGWKKSG